MRRRLVKAACCLALGVVTTVGVAWGVALQSHLSECAYMRRLEAAFQLRSMRTDGDPRLLWIQREGFGITVYTALHEELYAADGATRERAVDANEPPNPLRRVAEALAEFKRLTVTSRTLVCGWPFRALSGSCVEGRSRAFSTFYVGAATPRDLLPPLTDSDATIPLTPVPLGFAADTAIYGAAWWVLLLIPGAVRRRIRAARGLCPRCAYDLSGVSDGTCPECGRTQSKGERTG